MKKRLRARDGRVWEIETRDALQITVVARDGESRRKERRFASPAAAVADAESQVWNKLADGYVDLDPAPVTSSKHAIDPALRDPRRVLLVRGDDRVMFVRDRLLVLVRRSAKVHREWFASLAKAEQFMQRSLDEHVAKGFRVELDGDPSEDDLRETETPEPERLALSFEVQKGFLVVTFSGDDDDAIDPRARARASERAVDRIVSSRPTAVRVRCDLRSPDDHWARAIARQTLASVESFVFDTEFQTVSRQAENSLGDLSATLDALTAVQRVWYTGRCELSRPVSMPHLRSLVLIDCELSAQALDALSRSTLPSLETLTLVVANERASVVSDAAVAKTIAALGARDVCVRGVRGARSLLAQLAQQCRRTRRAPPSYLSIACAEDEDEDELSKALQEHRAVFDHTDLAVRGEFSTGFEERARAWVASIADADSDRERVLPSAYLRWPSA